MLRPHTGCSFLPNVEASGFVSYCRRQFVCVSSVSSESRSHSGGRRLQLCGRTTRAAWPARTHGNTHTHTLTLLCPIRIKKHVIYDLSLAPGFDTMARSTNLQLMYSTPLPSYDDDLFFLSFEFLGGIIHLLHLDSTLYH